LEIFFVFSRGPEKEMDGAGGGGGGGQGGRRGRGAGWGKTRLWLVLKGRVFTSSVFLPGGGAGQLGPPGVVPGCSSCGTTGAFPPPPQNVPRTFGGEFGRPSKGGEKGGGGPGAGPWGVCLEGGFYWFELGSRRPVWDRSEHANQKAERQRRERRQPPAQALHARFAGVHVGLRRCQGPPTPPGPGGDQFAGQVYAS